MKRPVTLLLPLFAVCFFAGIWSAKAQPAGPPRIVLPPGELNPHAFFAAATLDGTPDWGVVKLKCPDAWKSTKGKGVIVAVLDTGAPNHPDLAGRVKASKDFTRSSSGAADRQGHGTHCAGTIAANGRLPGVAPEADIIAGKVLGDQGEGGVDGIAAGIRWAVDSGAKVISMSLGGPSQDSYIPPALDYALSKGVIILAAAGNEGPREGTVGFPGGYKQCIAVAAVDSSLNTAQFSSRGRAVYVAGPGVNIKSTFLNGQYATMSGTSMATPHLAGIAAL
jgi:subtilisin